MTDQFLDISDTYFMVEVDESGSLVLKPEIRLWCQKAFGYSPRLVFNHTKAYVQLVFRNAIDPTLFRISYAEKWQ